MSTLQAVPPVVAADPRDPEDRLARFFDAGYVAAGLLALTNGLGASVIGGQRSGEAASVVLRYHLDRLFSGR